MKMLPSKLSSPLTIKLYCIIIKINIILMDDEKKERGQRTAQDAIVYVVYSNI